MIETFILRWGYLAIALGTFLEGEAVLIAGGALAHQGRLSLPIVMIAAFFGSLASDQLWFHVGRRVGKSGALQRPGWAKRSDRTAAWLERYGAVFVLGFRFLYGMRTITPIVIGTSSYPTGRFAALNATGAALWAAAIGALGWLLGASVEALLRRASRVEELLAAAVIAGIAIAMVGRWARRRWSVRNRV